MEVNSQTTTRYAKYAIECWGFPRADNSGTDGEFDQDRQLNYEPCKGLPSAPLSRAAGCKFQAYHSASWEDFFLEHFVLSKPVWIVCGGAIAWKGGTEGIVSIHRKFYWNSTDVLFTVRWLTVIGEGLPVARLTMFHTFSWMFGCSAWRYIPANCHTSPIWQPVEPSPGGPRIFQVG